MTVYWWDLNPVGLAQGQLKAEMCAQNTKG